MKRSQHDLSHEHKTSFDMGKLVPVFCEEVLPGDTFRMSTSALARVASLANPVMHNVELRVHHWYVPNRIIWSDWEDFITGASSPTYPTVTNSTTELTDYMGVYPDTGLTISALPVRAYNSIWNNYYRDQDLVTERSEDTLTLADIMWGKDYFTTCRSAPQQGTAVSVGFSSGSAPVQSSSTVDTDRLTVLDSAGTEHTMQPHSTDEKIHLDTAESGSALTVDLSGATGGIDINELRQSIALQRIAEARAFFGERYEDYLRFLGINPSDGRLSRPEFLGGSSEFLNFSEVLATASNSTDSVSLGDMAGHGIGAMRTRRYQKMFEEHGWVLTLASARPRTAYMQSVPRKFTKTDPMDYWQKELEVLPWQEVPQSEVHYNGSASTIFGYAPKYEEYRHHMSHVSGIFRTTDKDWHMARDITAAPTLNSSFVTCDPTDRIYNDATEPELRVNFRHNIETRRLVRRDADFRGAMI
jgi:hypothetical protein